MNILFVNYGDFTTNSLNHIGGFANTLCAAGHACIVAVPSGRETVSHLREPLFIPATYEELLAKPGLFPDNRPAELIHAWTPREGVRKFILGYQRALLAAGSTAARLIIHLEDNERYLLEAYTGKRFADLRDLTDTDNWLLDGLPDPLRHESLLRIADGVTYIIDKLRDFIPAGTPSQALPPGLDFALYHPSAPDEALRTELGLRAGERVIVFTGSNTFANEPEMRDLYLAVALLNQRGIATRLIRTGFNSPRFLAGLAFEHQKYVLDLGFVEKAKLPKLLALADVLVQPGRPGPFNDYRLPSKLPEFLALGKPVILPATNLALLMQDGREAVFLKNGSPDEIADRCRELFEAPALCDALGKNAAAFAHKHFDLAANTAALAGFYEYVSARPAAVDWTPLRNPLATETALVTARLTTQLAMRTDAALASEFDHLAHLSRQLEAALEAWRRQPDLKADQLTARIAALDQHALNLQKLLDETRHLSEQHVGNLKEGLRLTQNHAAHLERTLSAIEPAHARSETLRQQAETLFRSARQQCLAFEQEIERMEREAERNDAVWRGRLQLAETNFRQSDRETAYYKKLLQQQLAEGQAVAQRANEAAKAQRAVLQSAHEEIARRDAKLKRMQESFSWSATAWLRFLRRTFFDSKAKQVEPPLAVRPLPPAEPPLGVNAPAPLDFRFSVDYPQAWSFPVKTVLVRGWCLAAQAEPALKAIRAQVNGRRYPGVYGLKRLDVFATMRDVPQAEYCGWKIEVPLEAGDTELALEVGDDEGGWHRFFTTPVRVGDDTGPAELTSYEQWALTFDTLKPDALRELAATAENFKTKPLISIVVPVYNTPEKWLTKVVDSVRAQVYPRWELCLANDASPAPHLRPLLDQFAASDSRIKVVHREKNGHISASSNSALQLATGEFVALLDHDDELTPNALYEVVALLNAHPDTDWIYSDEDKIDEEGHRHEPYFKPDWLPDLFHAQNYTSHLTVYRTALVRAAGGFREGYEGSQDWDLGLRILERIEDQSRIRHIPKILYHWRAIPGSTALMLSEKNYPLEAARRALTDHFARIGQKITLHHVPGDHWHAQYPLPSPAPLVSLIIPTRNGLKFLQRCVDSILEKTTYPNYEVIVVDNGSDDPATLAYLASLTDGSHPHLRNLRASAAATPGTTAPGAKVLRYDAPFNFSAINNFAVAQAGGELVGLLNNDLEVITPSWLDEMAAQALRPGIGCVGAMLYYPNDTIQHAGCIIGLGGVAGHAFRDFPRGTEGKFNRARLVQNYSAVTAACLLVRRSIYEQVGGLDETNLTVAFNDIDFCLKVRAAGYRNLWTPFAELYHHESVSRGAEDTPAKHERFRGEVEYMLKRWAAEIRHDPAYNPNLTLDHTDFTLAAPPRPWLG